MKPYRRRLRRCTKKLEGFLRDNFPLGKPVTVRWAKALPFSADEAKEMRISEEQRKHGCFGYCTTTEGKFRIQISERNDSLFLATDTLMHEWAHALDARVGRVEECRGDYHDASFWITFGNIKRVVFEALKAGDLDWNEVYYD